MFAATDDAQARVGQAVCDLGKGAQEEFVPPLDLDARDDAKDERLSRDAQFVAQRHAIAGREGRFRLDPAGQHVQPIAPQAASRSRPREQAFQRVATRQNQPIRRADHQAARPPRPRQLLQAVDDPGGPPHQTRRGQRQRQLMGKTRVDHIGPGHAPPQMEDIAGHLQGARAALAQGELTHPRKARRVDGAGKVLMRQRINGVRHALAKILPTHVVDGALDRPEIAARVAAKKDRVPGRAQTHRVAERQFGRPGEARIGEEHQDVHATPCRLSASTA